MFSGINSTLLHHLATGAGAASLLRSRKRNLVDLVKKFFESRTDIRRLTTAQDVANEILSINDLTDMMAIRDIVAKQELRRQINYIKQQDHTAHTVYLYFLGLWFYDNLPQLSSAIGERSKIQDPLGRDSYFLLQWTYASLLHDVGYAFYNLDADTNEDRELIDSLYSQDWVLSQAPKSASANSKLALLSAHSAWSEKYGKNMRPGTATYTDGSYGEVLERLGVTSRVKLGEFSRPILGGTRGFVPDC
jgi:hypothetical protein